MKQKTQKNIPHPLLSFEEYGTQLVLGLGQAPPHVRTGVLNRGQCPQGAENGFFWGEKNRLFRHRYTWSS